MQLTDRATEVYQEEGLSSLIGRSLRFAGNNLISSSSDQKEKIIENYTDDKRYLNVGGADFLKENWRVLDYYTDWYDYDPVFVDFNVDLEKKNRWPIKTESYDLVYSSHTLEHLTDATVEHTLSEAYRILSPKGTIRINVPDVDIAARAYDNSNVEWFEEVWLENYTESVYYPGDKCPGYELEFYLLSFFATYLARKRHQETDFQRVQSDWQGLNKKKFFNKYSGRIRDKWQEEYPGWHRNWFTSDRLKKELNNVGFTNIIETNCRQSHIAEMCTTEFDKRPHMSVFVEATKTS